MPSSRLIALDGLRGIAAVIVLVHHSLLLVPGLAAPYFGQEVERRSRRTARLHALARVLGRDRSGVPLLHPLGARPRFRCALESLHVVVVLPLADRTPLPPSDRRGRSGRSRDGVHAERRRWGQPVGSGPAGRLSGHRHAARRDPHRRHVGIDLPLVVIAVGSAVLAPSAVVRLPRAASERSGADPGVHRAGDTRHVGRRRNTEVPADVRNRDRIGVGRGTRCPPESPAFRAGRVWSSSRSRSSAHSSWRRRSGRCGG